MDAKKFVADFQLVGNTIRSLTVKNPVLVHLDDNCEYKRTLDISHEIVNISHEDFGLLGVVKLSVKTSIGDENGKLGINIVIEGAFTSKNATEEQFATMLSINGIAALYSVVRSIVLGISAQSLTSGTIMLPMINVYQYSKKVKPKTE